MVLISDFVNRNKVVIAFITLELKGTNARTVDLWLASGVGRKGDVAREITVVYISESRSLSNIWMMRIVRKGDWSGGTGSVMVVVTERNRGS